jgi:hypothetical protein
MYLKIKIGLKDGYLFKTRSGLNYMLWKDRYFGVSSGLNVEAPGHDMS